MYVYMYVGRGRGGRGGMKGILTEKIKMFVNVDDRDILFRIFTIKYCFVNYIAYEKLEFFRLRFCQC